MSRPGGLAPGICAHLQLSHKGYKPQHTCTIQQQGIKIWSDDVKKSIALIDREEQVYCVEVRRQQPLNWKCLLLGVLHP